MTKHEYLSKNLDAVFSLDIKPFRNIDCIEKGLFNYQYYNALAKDAKSAAGSYDTDTNNYYREKDKATLSILRLLEYRNVSAYFIRVRSKYLKGRIFEIVLNDYNNIMHSKNNYVLKCLKDAGVFMDGIHVSLIDGYINQPY